MSVEMQILQKEGYLEATVRGPATSEASLYVVKRLAAACAEHDCFRVLVLTHFTNTLTVIENYTAPAVFDEAGITHKHRIAWVDMNPDTFRDSHFAETVLQNRGYTMVQLFDAVESARSWLLSSNVQSC